MKISIFYPFLIIILNLMYSGFVVVINAPLENQLPFADFIKENKNVTLEIFSENGALLNSRIIRNLPTPDIIISSGSNRIALFFSTHSTGGYYFSVYSIPDLKEVFFCDPNYSKGIDLIYLPFNPSEFSLQYKSNYIYMLSAYKYINFRDHPGTFSNSTLTVFNLENLQFEKGNTISSRYFKDGIANTLNARLPILYHPFTFSEIQGLINKSNDVMRMTEVDSSLRELKLLCVSNGFPICDKTLFTKQRNHIFTVMDISNRMCYAINLNKKLIVPLGIKIETYFSDVDWIE